jgi:hypothetical protein
MARAEAIARARTALAELSDKHGLAFPAGKGERLLKQADDLRLKRVVMSPPKTVMPCAAELLGVGMVDPCLIVPASLPLELLPSHQGLAVGGQVMSLARSLYGLSPYITEEAWRAQGFWNGQPLPLLVSIKGAYKYLLKQKSYFFKFEEFVGSDIDQLSPLEPDAKDLKLQRFHWGSDLTDQITLVIAEY